MDHDCAAFILTNLRQPSLHWTKCKKRSLRNVHETSVTRTLSDMFLAAFGLRNTTNHNPVTLTKS